MLRDLLPILTLLFATGAPNPITIMNAAIDVDHDGKQDAVSIVMTKGRRYNDEEDLCCNCRDKYEGYFAAVVNVNGRLIETPLNPLLLTDDLYERPEDPLSFYPEQREIVTADYNRDGEIDFNLGQYASCNGFAYWMLTIRSSGKVEKVSSDFRVSDFANSTSRITPVENGFRFIYYDNSPEHGGHWDTIYRWNAAKRIYEMHGERREETPNKALEPTARRLSHHGRAPRAGRGSTLSR
jgi:hypothetical protein